MPDLTREEVEAIIACAEHNSPALEANEIRRLGTLALRQMDEIERLLVEYRKMYDWGEVLDKDRNTLTTDLAAAHATIERVEALAKEWRVRKPSNMLSAPSAACDVFAALRGEGAKDARS